MTNPVLLDIAEDLDGIIADLQKLSEEEPYYIKSMSILRAAELIQNVTEYLRDTIAVD